MTVCGCVAMTRRITAKSHPQVTAVKYTKINETIPGDFLDSHTLWSPVPRNFHYVSG